MIYWRYFCEPTNIKLIMKMQHFSGRYPFKSGDHITVNVLVIIYEEEGIHYAYCAALDVTGYGKTEDEAHRSFEITLSETISYAVSNGTLLALLESMGWNKNTPPKMTDLAIHNQDLADILNTKAYRTYKQDIVLPA